MDSASDDEADPEALIVVNQVAYNTQYSVDFLKDGQAAVQQKVYRATKLAISPGSFDREDNGNCEKAGTSNYIESNAQQTKTGLAFTITVSCQPTLITDVVEGDYFPTGVRDHSTALSRHGIDYDHNGYFTKKIGQADTFAVGSYLYHNFTANTDAGNITVRAETRIQKMVMASMNFQNHL